jgi:predicted dehydrogenase
VAGREGQRRGAARSWLAEHAEQRGFAGCARHFITCVQNQTVPETSGEQAILAQRIVERLWRDAMSE